MGLLGSCAALPKPCKDCKHLKASRSILNLILYLIEVFLNLNFFSERERELQRRVKPRLHQRFFACDRDAIFFRIVASPARGGGYTW